MRWSGQKIEAEAEHALPGLARVSNLVRSVTTPEFAGVTFHEVLAKSALNHLPAAEALPFGWTINPYRGCTHACTFCLVPDTLILGGDGRQRRLADLHVGDPVYGTVVPGADRRWAITTVTAVRRTTRRAYRVVLADGTEIVASAEHRFLTDRGWRHVAGAVSGAGQRACLTTGNRMMGFGSGRLGTAAESRASSAEYRRGYLAGMIRGDGMLSHGDYRDARRLRTIHRFRLALTDVEALERTREYLATEGVPTLVRPFTEGAERHRAMTAIHTARAESVAAIERLVRWPEAPHPEWDAGFLGGVFDAEGSLSRSVLRVANTDDEFLTRITSSMTNLDIAHVREPARPSGVATVRVVGGFRERQRFLRVTTPAISRKLRIEGGAVQTFADLRVVEVEDLGFDTEMIDITTGTGDFVANGVISHNCFARATHTYLDLDAGADFDSQIVVKVNVADVLQRELARPSWTRHPVALGTNTDPYQRAEGRYRLMPGITAALAASGTPFSILTKGTLLRRDLPLLSAAAEQVPVDLAVSIAVLDPELSRSVESGAPSTAARLATIAAARDAGFAPAVFVMPVLPYLTDSRSHLDRLLGAIADAGAASVAYSALHLRQGAREWYLRWLGETHPGLVERYERMYRGSPYAPKEYRRWLADRIGPILRRHRLDRTRTEPATGAIRSRAHAAVRLEGGARAGLTGRGLLAAELTPAAAAAIQPTLF